MEITINKTTPRLFMWFCNGQKAAGNLPLPSGENLDYLSTLQQRCQEAEASQTPIILAYEGRLISEEQKTALESLAQKDEFKNLFLVDYNEFKDRCSLSPETYEEAFANKINHTLSIFRDHPHEIKHNSSVGSISYLVDSTRLHLIDRCDVLKDHLKEKYSADVQKTSLIEASSEGLIYTDFDVSQKNGVNDIKLNGASQGFFCSTNLGVIKDSLSTDDYIIESELENSLIGVNTANHRAIKTFMNYWSSLPYGEQEMINDIPYDCFKAATIFMYGGDKANVGNHFGPLRVFAQDNAIARFDYFNAVEDSILSDHHGFQIGHDSTWESTRGIEYTIPLNQEESVEKKNASPSNAPEPNTQPSTSSFVERYAKKSLDGSSFVERCTKKSDDSTHELS